MTSAPKSTTARVTRSRQRAIESGAVAVPYTIIRDPRAIAALAALREQHGSIRAALEIALSESAAQWSLRRNPAN